jgi:3-keto-disaccharide hydrolase
MKRSAMAVTVFGMLAGAALAQGGAKVLFDGKSLGAWEPIGDANWTIVEGAVQATGGKGGHLVSKEQFGDFELSAEFWVESPETNSGIFIRCQDKSSISPKTCYEINIWDGRPEQDFATGGIVNVAKVITPVKTAGRWCTIVITASGPKMSVAVNGTRTAEGQHTQFARGPITLQYGGPGTVRFRNVQIRPL